MMHQNTIYIKEPNKKYVSFDGYFEAVYYYDNQLLNEETASEDMGTYNYGPSTGGNGLKDMLINSKEHYLKDMLPYFYKKNTKRLWINVFKWQGADTLKNINRFVSVCFAFLILEPLLFLFVFVFEDTFFNEFYEAFINFIYTVFFPPVVGFILEGILIFIYNKKYNLLTDKMRAILPIYIVVGVFINFIYFLFLGVYFFGWNKKNV